MKLKFRGEELIAEMRKMLVDGRVEPRLMAEQYLFQLPDKVLADMFIMEHVKKAARSKTLQEIVLPAARLVSPWLAAADPVEVAGVLGSFLDATADLIEFDEPEVAAVPEQPKASGLQDLDLGSAYRDLYDRRRGLVTKLELDNKNAPLIVYFDKMDKALSGVQSTLDSITKYRQACGELGSNKVDVTHRFESATQALLGEDDDSRSAMHDVAMEFVEFLEKLDGHRK